MFSSAKFLSPIVTAGLPTPGPLVAAAGAVAVVDVVELVLFEEDVLLPQAVSPTPAAISASIAEMPEMNLLLLRRLPVIRRLLMLSILLIEIIENRWSTLQPRPGARRQGPPPRPRTGLCSSAASACLGGLCADHVGLALAAAAQAHPRPR